MMRSLYLSVALALVPMQWAYADLASEVAALPTHKDPKAMEWAERYVDLRPDLFQGERLLGNTASVVHSPVRDAMVINILQSFRQAPNWNADNPEWQRMAPIITSDLEKLSREITNDPQFLAMEKTIRQVLVQALADQLTAQQLRDLADFYSSSVGQHFIQIALAMRDQMAVGVLEVMRRVNQPNSKIPPPADRQEGDIVVHLFDEMINMNVSAFLATPGVDRSVLDELVFTMLDAILIKFNAIDGLWTTLGDEDRGTILAWRATPLAKTERAALSEIAKQIQPAITESGQIQRVTQLYESYGPKWISQLRP